MVESPGAKWLLAYADGPTRLRNSLIRFSEPKLLLTRRGQFLPTANIPYSYTFAIVQVQHNNDVSIGFPGFLSHTLPQL